MNQKHILHLSLTNLQYDARVRRAMACGADANYRISILAPDNGVYIWAMNLKRKIALAVGFGLGSIIGIRAVEKAYWHLPPHKQMLEKTKALKPDIIHAHDWDTLPVAIAAARVLNIPVFYDSHEFASGMHHERLNWRYTMSPAIEQLESANIKQAAVVIAVSNGLADELEQKYSLKQKPTVIRNLPGYEKISSKKANDGVITLHYHGVLAAGRGIEMLVETLSYLPRNFRLQIVGPERQKNFLQKIEHIAKMHNVFAQMTVLPAVPLEELITLASTADIGLCTLTGKNPHYSFALPNKVFEYIMAGLYTVVAGSASMAEVINQYHAGFVFKSYDAKILAHHLKAITPEMLEKTRANNLQTAKSLCWDEETGVLEKLYKTYLS